MILATGTLLTFPPMENVKPDCSNQGYAIIEKISVYEGPGPSQGWYLNGSQNPRIQVAGWYCQ